MHNTMIGFLRQSKAADSSRVIHARDVLRQARARLGGADGLSAVVAALDEVEQLVPGLERCLCEPQSAVHAELAAEVRALVAAFELTYCRPILASG
jgi:hypothetical protein